MSLPKRQASCHPSRTHLAHGKCKQCYDKWYGHKNRSQTNAKARAWAKAHPDRIRAAQRKYHYGVTTEQVATQLKKQKGRCAICRRKPQVFHVDHNHKTGRFRGMLCGPCNRGLGLFSDRLDVLQAATAYILRDLTKKKGSASV